MKHKHQRRSDCSINFALETVGDPWSLLIIRDIVYFGKKTYGEFLASEEGIATNVLADRLAHLEQICSSVGVLSTCGGFFLSDFRFCEGHEEQILEKALVKCKRYTRA
jgi:hypothetical protein